MFRLKMSTKSVHASELRISQLNNQNELLVFLWNDFPLGLLPHFIFTLSFFIFHSLLFPLSFSASSLSFLYCWRCWQAFSESGLQKQLDRRRRPLETCQAVICPSPLYPPLPAHLCLFSSTHFNLFFLSTTIHPSSPSAFLSLLLYLSPPSPLFCISSLVSFFFKLTSFHLLLLFSSIIFNAVKSLHNPFSTLYCQITWGDAIQWNHNSYYRCCPNYFLQLTLYQLSLLSNSKQWETFVTYTYWDYVSPVCLFHFFTSSSI